MLTLSSHPGMALGVAGTRTAFRLKAQGRAARATLAEPMGSAGSSPDQTRAFNAARQIVYKATFPD
jgi:hypothetical protein